MHRRNREREKEIEQRLKTIISKAKPDNPAKSRARKIFTTLLFAATAIVLTIPLWSGWADQPNDVTDPVYNKIRRVSIEYPEDMEPNIKIGPVRSGCAFMPQAIKTSPLPTI